MAHCLKTSWSRCSIECEIDICGGIPNTNTFAAVGRPSEVGECYSDSSESNADYLTLSLWECLNQEELDSLIYESNLSKISSELLAFRLQDKTSYVLGQQW